MIKIILDTNFPIYLLKFKIRLEEELNRIIDQPYTLQILQSSIDELKKLSEKNLDAKLALQLVKKYTIIKTKEKHPDQTLAKIKDQNTIIATQDKELKTKLQTPKLIIRQKKYLEIKN